MPYKDEERNREVCRISARKHYADNADKIKSEKRRLRKEDPEYRRINNLKHARYMSKLTRDLRLQIYKLYGHRCNCCGIEEYCFLSIDHVKGGGSKEKKKFNQVQYLQFVLSQGFLPEKYQILCHNCNQAKGYYGQCPHKGPPLNPVYSDTDPMSKGIAGSSA